MVAGEAAMVVVPEQLFFLSEQVGGEVASMGVVGVAAAEAEAGVADGEAVEA